MDIFKEFATDLAKEEDGVEVDIGSGAVLKLARTGTKAYNKLVNKLFTANKRVLDLKNDAANTLSDNLMAEVMAKTVLKGWSGIEEDGKELPYSVENAQRLLRIKDFRALVLEKAGDMTNYKTAVEEEISGN
jgi:hypothetical protein